MTDGEVVAHFTSGRTKVLEEGGGWQDGRDRVWHPNAWVYAGGALRIPIQHREEEGAACDVDMIVREDGSINVRGGRSD